MQMYLLTPERGEEMHFLIAQKIKVLLILKRYLKSQPFFIYPVHFNPLVFVDLDYTLPK